MKYIILVATSFIVAVTYITATIGNEAKAGFKNNVTLECKYKFNPKFEVIPDEWELSSGILTNKISGVSIGTNRCWIKK